MELKFKVVSVRKYETSSGETTTTNLELQLATVINSSSGVYPTGYITMILTKPEDVLIYEDSFGSVISFDQVV